MFTVEEISKHAFIRKYEEGRLRGVHYERGDEVDMDVDVSAIGLSERTFAVSVYPIGDDRRNG